MKIKIEPSALSGSISAIPSKSDAHRLLIASLLSGERTEIYLPSSSVDIDTTINCIEALGARITRTKDSVILEKREAVNGVTLDCSESGSTFRFMTPVASVLCDRVSFEGRGRLPDRPIVELLDAMRKNGAEFSGDRLPFTKTGKLRSGVYELPGNVSSQYITGLLFALPLLEGNSEIRLTTKLESSAYIDITLWVLKRFGIEVEFKNNSYFIKGNQKYVSPSSLTVDGDWSNASYFLASGVEVTGLDLHSPQGDKRILDVFKALGGKIHEGKVIKADLSELSGCVIDISEIPDTFPTLAVLATRAKGETKFVGGARLRMKESDRIETTAKLIRALGGEVTEYDDGMSVKRCQLHGGEVDGAGDHRIVMATALASTLCDGEVIINGAEAVTKSYPSFFEDYEKLGGKCYVI
ncbi:MAG: 3-phosphoshikimate 1-carboxyvinyltransferase [Clostridia bacterium]|nr:3-phosphoshikimate 1-carboxyvinyltransferase [Clostridia bacterium]